MEPWDSASPLDRVGGVLGNLGSPPARFILPGGGITTNGGSQTPKIQEAGDATGAILPAILPPYSQGRGSWETHLGLHLRSPGGVGTTTALISHRPILTHPKALTIPSLIVWLLEGVLVISLVSTSFSR